MVELVVGQVIEVVKLGIMEMEEEMVKHGEHEDEKHGSRWVSGGTEKGRLM